MRRVAAVGLAALLLAAVASVRPAGTTRAADYIMATAAHYTVDQAAGVLSVSVRVAFSNTTPNPPGQLSGFDRVEIAVHPGASQLTAVDADGALAVQLSERDGVAFASVSPRSRIGSGEAVDFTLGYQLADGAPNVHVRPQVVQFPAWGFGTSSSVLIDLPAGLQVQVAGANLASGSDASGIHLSSGPIGDPSTWIAQISATLPIVYRSASRTVALSSGTVELQVRFWTSDPTWGDETLDLLSAALPLLERSAGLSYPRLGPLVVVETLPTADAPSEPLAPTAEIQAGYAASPFSLLHQVAHLWASEQLASERWIREGLASHLAASVAGTLGVEPPYDPESRTAELGADAEPLESWSAQADDPSREAYGYAASWALVDQIAERMGDVGLRQALARIAGGLSAYDLAEVSDQPAEADASFAPADSRRLLDQLASASGIDLADEFATTVFDADVAAELSARGEARRALASLDAAAGDWGRPVPIQEAMAEWRFEDAQAAIGEAAALLADRDELLAAIERAGLSTPDRLEERWRSDGGAQLTRAELQGEAAVVTAYQAALDSSDEAPGVLQRIGLLGGDDPRALLRQAAASFAAGELQEASDAISRATARTNAATLDGILRIVAAGLVLALLLVLLIRPRRWRRPSDYTAAP